MLKRLTTLAEFLKTIPKEKFDLTSWRSSILDNGGKTEEDDGQLSDDELKHTCGTTGCAVGWACTIPEFNDQNFVWYDGSPAIMSVQGYRLRQGWEAVAGFFGISASQAHILFDSDSYDDNASPLDVAFELEKFVSKAEESARNV